MRSFIALVLLSISAFPCRSAEPGLAIEKWLKAVEEISSPREYDTPDPIESSSCLNNTDLVEQISENGILTGIFRNGTVLQISSSEQDIMSASGNASLTTGDFEIQGYFSRGCFKGLVRFYRIYDLDFEGEERRLESALIGITYLSMRGVPYAGPTWSILRGTLEPNIFGYMLLKESQLPRLPNSHADFKDMFSGKRVLMVYPDYETLLQGEFSGGDLVEGRTVKLRGASQNKHGIMDTVISEPFGDLYKRDEASKEQFSIQPFLKDPYEAKTLDILPSRIASAGDGVFTKRSIRNGTTMGFFKGFHLREKDIEPLSMWNVLTLSTQKSKFLIQYGEHDGYLDVPPESGEVNQYNATTAHKVNHSRKPNAGYYDCNHPRFGEILCLQASEDIGANQELFVRYAISVNRDSLDRIVTAGFLASQTYTGKSKDDLKDYLLPYIRMIADINKEHPIQNMIEDVLGFN